MSASAEKWYDFLLQQMAAEAYLEGVTLANRTQVADALASGNNRQGFEVQGATRFTSTQFDEFWRKFELVDQWSDNPTATGSRPTSSTDVGYLSLNGEQILANTGLSATLIRRKDSAGNPTNEYTLAIRSTEFRKVSDGGDRDRDAWGADLGGIALDGFALAQLDALESYYTWLKQTPNKLPQGAVLHVTGYSLGGHLATVFVENHARDTDVSFTNAYTFNGAGRGTWSTNANDPSAIIAYYVKVFANPELARPNSFGLPGIASSKSYYEYIKARQAALLGLPVDPLSLYADPRYLWARTAAINYFGLGVINPLDGGSDDLRNGVAAKLTQLYGKEFPVEATGVANSGVHGPALGVFAEAQPLLEGRAEFVGGAADWGNGHQIVLIADSLALMRSYQKLDPGLTLDQLGALFSVASNKHAVKALTGNGENASAEDDALENALDGLRRVFLGPGVTVTPYRSGAGGLGDIDSRNAFYGNLTALESNPQFQAASGKVNIKALPATEAAIADAARQDIAYRYALATLSPFAVTGVPELFDSYNKNGELDIFNPETGKGVFTTQYLEDRAAMLAAQIDANTRNSGFSVVASGAQSVLYEDRSAVGAGDARESSVIAFAPTVATDVARPYDGLGNERRSQFMNHLYERQVRQNKGRKVLFGHEGLIGGTQGDDLYGSEAKDDLLGNGGNDYLQGNAGDDRLIAGAGDDTLLGGTGYDTLDGGAGTDKYYFYTGGGSDTIIDLAEDSAGAYRQLGEVYFNDVRISGKFSSLDSDKKNFRLYLGDQYYRASYFGDINTATPGKLMLWNEADGSNVVTLTKFISGDFGIVLDPNAPPRVYTDKPGTDDPDNSFLVGVPHQDSLSSDAPDQRVFGYGGSDYIVAGNDNVLAYGGEGNDYITNGAGDQGLYGEAGRDVLVATAGDDTLDGGAGDDALQGGADRDSLSGGDGNDVLDGGAGEDVIAGGDGNDFIFGGGSVTVAISDWNAFADGSLDWGAFDASGNVLLHGLAGLANVEGDGGDVITSGAGNDWVFAGDGVDTVSGGADNDYLVGQAGGDSLSGDDGDDALYGDGAQGDLLEAPGNFTVYTLPEFHGDDSLYGGAGRDYLSGDGGADDLYGGDGDDTLVGDSANVPEPYHGADYLDGGEGNDLLLGYGKNDTLFGGPGDDELGGDSSSIDASLHGDDTLDGEDGDDVLHGDGGSDTLFGGAGNDILDGDASNVAVEYHGDDYLDGGDGNDALQGGGGADRLFGGAGNDSLVGDGADVPDAYAGDDYLDGEAGDDVLEAGAGNDTLVGGPGSDILRGQAGDDTYYVSAGDQSDFVDDREGANTIVFDAGASFAGVYAFQTLGSDGNAYLGLRYSASDSVYVRDGLTNPAVSYEFADGTVATAADWRARLSSFSTIYGGSGADDLAGTALADLFVPGGGDDTIRFGPGSGFDRVSGFGQEPAQFQGVDLVRVGGGLVAGDLDVARDVNGNLTLTIRDTGDTLQLDAWSVTASAAPSGYEVEFDDGSGLTAADLVARAMVATDGNDVLVGGPGADTISGGDGDDYLFGNNNSNPAGDATDANVLLGGAGDDRITGGIGADVIDGGPGDDVLLGMQGADTYLFGAGDGADVVTDSGGEGNVVVLKVGITPDDIALFQGSIIIALDATGDTLTVQDWYGEDDRFGTHHFVIDALRFDDGTEWDAARINEAANHATPFADTLRGIHTGDVLYGLGGDDSLSGYAGDDVLSGGDGDDTLEGGIGADDLDGGAGDDYLVGGHGDDVLAGGAGNDTLSGGQGDDVYLIGRGGGTDSIGEDSSSGYGGSMDVVRFVDGILPQDVTVLVEDGAIVADYGSGRVRVGSANADGTNTFGIEQLRFDDGTVWTPEEIVPRAPPPVELVLSGGDGMDSLVGGDGDDVLLGGAGDDDLKGGAGDDVLDGGAGDDYLYGGPGNDSYRFAPDSGHDHILETPYVLGADGAVRPSGDLDVVALDAAIAPGDLVVGRDPGSLIVSTADGAASVVLSGFFSQDFGPQQFALRFADGTTWDGPTLAAMAGTTAPGDGADLLYGTAQADTLAGLEGDDTLVGLSGDDTLDGGAGDDLLLGGYGNDTYVFGYGSGDDTIREPISAMPPLTRATAGGHDRILFSADVQPKDALLEFDQYAQPTIRLASSGDTLRFESWGDTVARVEVAEFADGTVWDLGKSPYWGAGANASVTGSAREIGTPGSDFPAMGFHDDMYFGLAGPDTVTDINGNNTLYGGDQNDTLTGGTGDDVLDGGAGNDRLSPGAGDNVIRFGRGAGADTVTLTRYLDDLGSDTIEFGEGVRPEHVLMRNGPGNALIVELAGSPDVLTLNPNLFAPYGRDRLRFEFADGTLWDAAEIAQRIRSVALIEGGTGNDILTGGDGDDRFVGGEGNDTLTGGGGRDSFYFYRGDGTDTVIDEAPHIVFGDGIRPEDVAISGSNFVYGQHDLFLTVANGGGQVIARNWFPATHDGTIEFADGTVWDAAYVGARIPYAIVSGTSGTFTGTPGDDSYAFGATADTMRGHAGDDTLSGGTGDDDLQGDAGNDLLDGGEGDDTLAGGEGDDALAGRAGRDILSGDEGDDLLEGGDGGDLVYGGAGDDTLDGGTGDDRLYGGQGSDTYLFGVGSGDDTLVDFDAAGGALDTVRMGAGVLPAGVSVERAGLDLVLRLAPGGDSLAIRTFGRAGYGVERVVFDDGSEWSGADLRSFASLAAATSHADVLAGTAADDALAGLAGDDVIEGAAGADFLEGGDGDDILLGGEGDDTLDGGAGYDALYGGPGSDVFLVRIDSGSDSIADLQAGDTVSFGPGIAAADVRLSRDRTHLYLDLGPSGQLVTLENWFAGGAQGTVAFDDGTAWDGALLEAAVNAAGDGDDFLVGGPGADTIAALGGLDTVYAGGGDDAVSGGDDADTLYGEDGNDVLEGGAGDDLLDGGTGDDFYVFAPGFGADTIAESDTTSGNVDSIRFAGIAPDAVALSWTGNDFLIEIAGSGDRIELPDAGISLAARIERVEFDDGTAWDQPAMYARMARYGTEGGDTLSIGVLASLHGLGGDDVLNGSAGDDVLDGGAGDDRLAGGAGSDTYLFGTGYGHDTVSNLDATPGRIDEVLFNAEVTPQQVSVERDGNQILFALDDGGDLKVENWFSGPSYQLTQAEFADGTVWSAAEIEARIPQAPATEGDDVLLGLSGPDTIDGLGGDDRIEGGFGDDVLSGGAGNDTLIGGAGNDLYLFGPGFGFDTAIDVDATAGNLDAVALDALPGEVAVGRDSANLTLALPGGSDRLALQSWFSSAAQRIEEVRLADGTVWDVAALYSLASGIAPGPRLGTDGPDYISGTPGDDVLDGGAGDDTLAGGAGNDTYRFGPGYGRDTIIEFDATPGNLDVVEMAALPADAEARRAGSNLELRLASGDALVVSNWFAGTAQKVELVRFSDGTQWDAAALESLVNVGFTYTGTPNADVIAGSEGPDTLEGLAGNDRLSGAGGDDVYRYAPGDGFDTIIETGGFDTLEFGAGIAPADVALGRSGSDLTVEAGGETIRVQGWFGGSSARVELIRFEDGTEWTEGSILAATEFTAGGDFIRGSGADDALDGLEGDDTILGGPGNDSLSGSAGDDLLDGEAGNDVLDGGAGRDLLVGGPGDDRFVFDAGYGEDRVVDSGGADEVAFGAGIAPGSLAFTRDLANLYVSSGTDRLTLVDWFASESSRIETFGFADGSALDEGGVRALIQVASTTALSDTIFGSDADDSIAGGNGEDALYGEGGDDVLDGGPGSDYLFGGAGDDTYYVDNRLDRVTEDAGEGFDRVFSSASYVLGPNIETLTLTGAAAIDGTGDTEANLIVGNTAANVLAGGAGDDVLEGGLGDDVYVFGRGDGADEVADVDATPGNYDQIRFADGIAPGDVRVTRESDDVRLRVAGDGGSVLMRNWYLPDGQIEAIAFADGTTWDAAAIDMLANLPANSPPQLTAPIADQSALEDSLFALSVAAAFTDPDAGDVLTYDAALVDGAPLPAWLGFDPASGTLAGTPGNDDVGTLEIAVGATDGEGERAQDAFALEVVNVNDAPTLVAPLVDQTGQEGAALAFSVAGAFADVDAGDTLAYAATLADGGALPEWLAFDPASQSFSAAPGYSDGGSYLVRVTATDIAGASASGDFALDILEAEPPVEPGGGGHHGHHHDEDHHHHHGHDRDDRHDKPARHKHHHDPVHERLAKPHHFDFEAIVRELERHEPRHPAPSPAEIRAAWERVARHAAKLRAGGDDFEHGAPWQGGDLLRLAPNGGHAFGFDASTGAARAQEGFTSFKGLSEGFRRL